MSHLFVYGTLRPGSPHPMARRLAELARHVGQAVANGRMYRLGRYPGMTEPGGPEDEVVGDVYALGARETETLRELDLYENAESPRPAFFDRQRTTVRLPGGEALEAWAYWFRGNVEESQRIASGDWLA